MTTKLNKEEAFLEDVIAGNVELIGNYIDNGVDIDCTDSYSQTALIKAVLVNDLEMVETILAHHPDVNKKDTYGNSALFYACQCCNLDIILILLKQVNIKLPPKFGNYFTKFCDCEDITFTSSLKYDILKNDDRFKELYRYCILIKIKNRFRL